MAITSLKKNGDLQALSVLPSCLDFEAGGQSRAELAGQEARADLVSRSQTFRLTAEGLECIAAFIGQGPPMRPFERHVKQPITVRFVQRHVSGRGNVATITDTLEL